MVVATICCLLISMAFAWLLAETDMLTIRLPMGRNPEPITEEISEPSPETILTETIIATTHRLREEIRREDEGSDTLQEGTQTGNQGRERPQ